MHELGTVLLLLLTVLPIFKAAAFASAWRAYRRNVAPRSWLLRDLAIALSLSLAASVVISVYAALALLSGERLGADQVKVALAILLLASPGTYLGLRLLSA